MYSPKFYQQSIEEDERYYQYQEMLHLDWEEVAPLNYQSPVAQFKHRLEEDRKNDR